MSNHYTTDEQLVQLIQLGDIPAFEQLVKRYQGKLFGYAVRITHDEKDAQEVVQDSFLAIYKVINRIDISRKFSSYLYAITKNTAISYLRRKQPVLSLENMNLIDNQISLAEKAALSDEANEIRNLMQQLNAKEKRVLNLYYDKNLSYHEISSYLNLPINTVRTHLHRAKKSLLKLLGYERPK